MGKEDDEINMMAANFVPADESNLAVTNGKANKEAAAQDLLVEKPKYPWYIVFILGNEFCERFSYYGMKTVLTLYFVEVLLWDEDFTTLIYHLFTVFAYFTPILGAMLADGILGKFNTIFSLSLVYVAGLVLLTLSAVTPLGLDLVAGTACGLVLIGLGTGGIKPVVPAYGGDQFVAGQEKDRERFFSVFYFAINAGSLISTFLTPILRSDVPCLGNEGCYPLAFGLPAGLLAIAVLAFVAGRPFYRNVPSKESIIAKVFACTFGALSNKLRGKGPRHTTHWLDNASSTYSADFIKDVKQLLPVLLMFVPLPIFWALFDQQGSRWTLQATRMDGRVTDEYSIKPDQIQIANPILILALIPLFEGIIFPLLDRFNIPFKSLARMTLGMVLAGVAFVVAGIIQMQLNNTLPIPLELQTAELRFVNIGPCGLSVNIKDMDRADYPVDANFQLTPWGEEKMFENVPMKPTGQNWTMAYVTVTAADCPALGSGSFSRQLEFNITHMEVHSIVFGADGSNGFTSRHLQLENKEKPKEGKAQARFALPFRFNTPSGGGEVTLINKAIGVGKKGHMFHINFDRTSTMFDHESAIANATLDVEAGKFEVYYPDVTAPGGKRRVGGDGRLELKNGGVFTVVLRPAEEEESWKIYPIIKESSLSVFWQLPQYFIITVGEVLFSVSGLSFAYSQAPTSMKSVLQAAWLMTVAVGNVIVIIIGSFSIGSQETEFYVFAGLIGVFAIIFAIMGRFYRYVDTTPPVTDEKAKISESDSNL